MSREHECCFLMFGDDKHNVNKEVLKFIKLENIMLDTKFESQAASTLKNLIQKLLTSMKQKPKNKKKKHDEKLVFSILCWLCTWYHFRAMDCLTSTWPRSVLS